MIPTQCVSERCDKSGIKDFLPVRFSCPSFTNLFSLLFLLSLFSPVRTVLFFLNIHAFKIQMILKRILSISRDLEICYSAYLWSKGRNLRREVWSKFQLIVSDIRTHQTKKILLWITLGLEEDYWGSVQVMK